jgi:uncharacterized protein (DUF488 family)
MIKKMKLFTIGFTKKSAKEFFSILYDAGVNKVIDIRLNNKSQLAGFTKSEDLDYFLNKICNIEYVHDLEFAPTKEILDDYKEKKITWSEYEKLFYELLVKRNIEKHVSEMPLGYFDGACFLCSEEKPDNCHRKLVIEYLRKKLDNSTIIHL